MSESLLNIIWGLGNYLKSIDVRSLAFNLKDEWINIVTSIFFSSKPIEKVREEHSRLKLPKMKSVKLFCFAQNIKSNIFSKGHISVKHYPSFLVDARIRTDCLKLFKSSIAFHSNHLRTYGDWKIFGVEENETVQGREKCWEHLSMNEGIVIPLGYNSIYEWINDSLKIINFSNSDKIGLIVGIPIHAKINSLKVKEDTVKVNVKSHKDVSNLFCNIIQQRFSNGWITIHNSPVYLQKPKTFSGNYVYYEEEVKFQKMKPHDTVVGSLRNSNFAKLEIDRNSARAPLEKPLEPLSYAFNYFYEMKEFKNQLFNPETFKKTTKRKSNPALLFEEAVSWLLSLAGLSVIKLGEQETINLPSGITYSADILAYKENEYLYVIDCDIQHISQNKVDNLLQIVALLEPIRDERGKPEIIPMIFTPKEPTTPLTIDNRVKIYNGSRIKKLYEEILKGEEIRHLY